MSQPEISLEEWAKLPFGDASEMIAAMRDPRYRSPIYPNRYNEAVAAKIALSEGIGTDQIWIGDRENSVQIGTGSLTGESPAEDHKATERAFAESRPDAPLAVNPNKIGQ
jgi:hypothetical protein